MRPNLHRLRLCRLFIQRRKCSVHKDRRPRLCQIARRTKRNRIAFARRCPLNIVPLRTVKWQLFAVHRKEILAKELAHFREQMSKPPDHRIVPPHRISCLGAINEKHHDDRKNGDTHNKYEQHSKKNRTSETVFIKNMGDSSAFAKPYLRWQL